MNHSAIISLYESQHKDKDLVEAHDHVTHQILYILEGEGECTLNKKDFYTEKDYFIIIPPETTHAITAKSKMTVLVLEFDATVLGVDVQNELVQTIFDEPRVQKLSVFDSSELRQLLRKMLYEQSHGDHFWKMALQTYMIELLFTIARSYQEITQPQDMNSLRVERLKQFIETRYFEITNAEDIANRMDMSTRYIQTIFKEYYGYTPLQYLTKIRLAAVKEMLVETNKDIISICFEVGFESIPTLYRLFKKDTGIPPNKYREITKKNNREK
ncbi:AraC family transcriptional regulator [Oceanobacillus timonensis]|uniref:AraC family transcriptional regulator n=1 Tax=Oceanobacillus timonensis TaxID=1926285 RepID=UPI0009B9C188|nr:helix-turn-helix domain-containing protein [Oceanobacillus timonensis]